MATIGEVLKQARDTLSMSQEDVASKIRRLTHEKFSRAALAQIESRSTKNPKPHNLQAACDVLKIEFRDALKGKLTWIDSSESINKKDLPFAYGNTEPGPEIMGRVPLITWIQAGMWETIIDTYGPGQAEEWRLTTAKVSKTAFALRVKGDSMTNPYGSPSIPEGYIIIVDPQKPINNGDLVVAMLDSSSEATFKKYVVDGPKHYLKPLNPAYPVIEINGNCTICGRVVKVELDL